MSGSANGRDKYHLRLLIRTKELVKINQRVPPDTRGR